MRILVTVYGFLTPSMTFVYNQVQAFRSEGHVVKVIACEIVNQELFPWEGISRIEVKKDFSHYISKIKRILGVEFTLQSKGFTTRFKDEVRAFKPDIIHVQFGTHLVRIYPAVQDMKIPVVTTFHGYDASQYLRNNLYVKRIQEILNQKNMFATTVSMDMRNRLQAHNINVSRTVVDYLGVDTSFFSPERENSEGTKKSRVFLQVSNFVEKKGHEFTIRAFAKYVKKTGAKDSQLVLAGDGPLLPSIKVLAQREEIDKNVQFPGLADRNEVRSLMNKADYFVHHSITAADGDMEGLPTVIMEAMAMELPVISTFHAGIPELVDMPDHGILVAEKDITNYAKAFEAIEDSPAVSSREKIVSHFNLDVNTNKILKIFERITHES